MTEFPKEDRGHSGSQHAKGRTHQPQRPIAVDLFAGAGGMTLGFEQAGFDVLAAVDIDPVHCATHAYNFPMGTMICRDVVELSGEQIRQWSPIGDREIDVVISGAPCQGFSIMGKRNAADPRNQLIFEFQRLTQELEPKYFVLENVRGLASGQGQPLLKQLIQRFKACGYQVVEDYRLLNAVDYGVPQMRQRLFLLGCRGDMTLPQYPWPTVLAATVRGKRRKAPVGEFPGAKGELQLGPTVWEAIGDLPEVEHYPELLEQDWLYVDYGDPSDYVKQLWSHSGCMPNYAYPRQYEPDLLTSSIRTIHSETTQRRFQTIRGGYRDPISRFHKLHPEGVCNTLRAGTDKKRGAFTAARPIHPFTPRCITVREAARLHSYPDWFRFQVTKWHGFRQVGNSVPPRLAQAVAQEIIKVLSVQPHRPQLALNLGEGHLLNFTWTQATQFYVSQDISQVQVSPVLP